VLAKAWVRDMLDESIVAPATTVLGPVAEKTHIRSSLGPFSILPGYSVCYPKVIIRALEDLYAEYNQAFKALIEKNREWPEDYQYCTASNFAVQIDMVGLPDCFLGIADGMPQEELREALREKIFEIENSIAMYQFLERLFLNGESATFFKRGWRASLDELRQRYGMPIALLAVTDQKYQDMKASEFGKGPNEPLTNNEVMDLSGFDAFLGPEEFMQHLHERSGKCRYLLFVRSSDPVSKLRNPEVQVISPLLDNSRMRRVIKAHALTLNVDSPRMEQTRRINDTKEYMMPMNMACLVKVEADLYSPGFAGHLAAGKLYPEFSGSRLSSRIAEYLNSYGVAPEEVGSGKIALRFKPMKGAYGCYGHVSGFLGDRKVRVGVRTNLQKRGPYVVQPEMRMPTMVSESGQVYTFIDRVFFAYINGKPAFIGGERSFMPLDSTEAKMGRNHGNSRTVWAQIT